MKYIKMVKGSVSVLVNPQENGFVDRVNQFSAKGYSLVVDEQGKPIMFNRNFEGKAIENEALAKALGGLV
jgi:hypothetical protein